MQNKLLVAFGVLGILGLIIPSWIAGLIALIGLSAVVPTLGLALGFCLDIIFGAPTWLPSYVAYPFTVAALVLGLSAIALEKYLR